MSNPNEGYSDPFDSSTEYSALRFLIRQFLSTVRGSTVVQVMAVYDINGNSVEQTGNLAPVGLLDVQPMVNLIDGAGNATEHGIICNVPYSRVQGGQNAIICDPQVGDIGVAVFSDQDISGVKATQAVANPGSWRRNDWADGIYLFGILNSTPNQYVQFVPNGINISDDNPNEIMMSNLGIKITDLFNNLIQTADTGITLLDLFGNTIVTSATGITIEDVNKNILTFGGTDGFNFTDQFGNTITTSSAGITINGTTFQQGGTTTYDTHVHGGVASGGADTSAPVSGS